MATLKEDAIDRDSADISLNEASNVKEGSPPVKRRKTIDATETGEDATDKKKITIKKEYSEEDLNGTPEKKRKSSRSNGNIAGSAIATVKEEADSEDTNDSQPEKKRINPKLEEAVGSDDSASSWDDKEIAEVKTENQTKTEDKPKPDVKSDDDSETEINGITSFKSLGPHLAKQPNYFNYDYIVDIPQICKDEPCQLGIDEAGRGPVLGPMVYGIAFCPLSKADNLKTLGCADSKQLTEVERERIFEDLLTKEYASSTVGWAIDVISPNYISNKMLSRVKVSLNEISMDSAIGLVNKAIDAGVNIAEVYVDTVGPPEKYQAKLAALFPDFQITVAKKADSTYPIVSAASICAKVARDQSLKYWKFPEGLTTTSDEFGSGYPNDPKTKAFLEKNVDQVFGFPRIVRFSWSTAVNVLTRKAYQMDFPDVEEERDLKYKAAGSIKKFLKPKAVDNDQEDMSWYVSCRFFRERCLEHCENI